MDLESRINDDDDDDDSADGAYKDEPVNDEPEDGMTSSVLG